MKLSKTYEPGEYEADIYALWEKSGAFRPTGKGTPFMTVMPPPNANANLHIGHALNNALQDIIVRYHRMHGRPTLFLPGADHAGFETQVVYEKQLQREGKSRFDFTREELYDQVYDFVQKNRGNMEAQVRAMGVSVDWSRMVFTLDPKIVKTAYQTFKKLWDEGLVYRGERLVNYCTFHRTAFADIEVLHREEKSKLWEIRYPLTSGDGEIVVATTRPETMLGDTAVAVNPGDKRYKHMVGKTVRLPLTGREVPVIADEFVDMAFGTGAVKITPAHDQNDYDAAERHALPMIRIINHEGVITAEAPEEYRGLTIKEARRKVLDDLEEGGFLKDTKEYAHSVGHCYKCDTVIEPMLMEQWFIDMTKLAGPAIKALENNEINFYPSAKKDQIIGYLKGVRDWNISRQIAWGIPIPAFRNAEDSDDWIFDERVNEVSIEIDGKTYHRDPDVFDTWFSSGQWPFATLDYPDGEDFKRFYPNSLMETGVDIMYQWVARQICLGIYVTGEIPFKDVYLHGMVRSEDGRKMSKSLGNVIDPNELIKTHGSDALRMGMITGRSAGESAAFTPGKIQAARNFCNKLWNVARYIESVIGDDFERQKSPEPVTIADFWMLSKLQQSIEKIGEDLDSYRFSESYDTLYHTLWDDFADWYLEASKGTPNRNVLAYCLEAILKMAHPFAPFVTETIWQTLKWEADSLLITATWPELRAVGDKLEVEAFETVKTIVSEIRTISTNLGLKRPVLNFRSAPFIAEHAELITTLAGLYGAQESPETDGLRLTSVPFEAAIVVDRETASKYLTKLEENQTAEALSVERLKARLANKSYVDNAPEQLVAETRAQLEAAQMKLQQITKEIDSFRSSTHDI